MDVVKLRLSVAFLTLMGIFVLANCNTEDVEVPLPVESILSTQEVNMQWPTQPAMGIDPAKEYSAVLQTSKGEVHIDLFASEVPVTANNFVFLAREGYNDGVPVHRIVVGFMIQTGDPSGTGRGDPGYKFDDEPVTRDYLRGIVAMANSGPNTNGSQFFIMHQNYQLPKNYTIFGMVSKGLDVVDAIANTPVTYGPSGEPSKPLEDVVIISATINES